MSSKPSVFHRRAVSQTHSLLAQVIAAQQKFPRLERSLASFLRMGSETVREASKNANRQESASKLPCVSAGRTTLLQPLPTTVSLLAPRHRKPPGLMVEAQRKTITSGQPPRFWLAPQPTVSHRGKYVHATTQVHENSYLDSSNEEPQRIHSKSRQKNSRVHAEGLCQTDRPPRDQPSPPLCSSRVRLLPSARRLL